MGMILSLIGFMFTLFFIVIPEKNLEIIKTCLTALISFISGSSLAISVARATRDNDKIKKIDEPTDKTTDKNKDN